MGRAWRRVGRASNRRANEVWGRIIVRGRGWSWAARGESAEGCGAGAEAGVGL